MTTPPDELVLHRGIGPPIKCRSCGVEIVFARSATTGKLMPFEHDDAEGAWVIVNGGASHQGRAPRDAIEISIPRWTSHFARCPHADQWRKR